DIPIEAIEDQQHYPISHSQNRLWIQDHHIASDVTYLVPVSYEVPDEIDIEDISRGFNYLLERHHSLRTIFRTVNGIPRQQIIELSLFVFNIQVISQHHTDFRYRHEINRPFDLSTAPLIRAQLVRIPGQGKLLNVTIHHILTDEWSMKIFYDDLVEYLIENVRKKPLKIQYKDFSIWQNSMIERGVFNHSKQYWADVFSKEIPLFKLGRESISQPFDGTGYSCGIHLPSWVKQ
ncbi:MAG: condensation domain-containing protein, partial [Flammeovirgaceae bacterium]